MKETRFKDTEVGRIPEDWEVTNLSNRVSLVNGRAYKQEELLNRGRFKVLRVGNFFTNDHWYYSNLLLPPKMYCNKGDLLYAWSCTYGAYIWNENKTIFHYHIWKLLPNTETDKYYLKYLLNYDVEKQKRTSQGSTMSHITKGYLEARLFVFPPILEQSRIASALTSIDNLIASLDKLIEKKKNIKQGTMQQLLTGKKRLKGFTEPWVEKVLGQVGKTYSGLTGKTKDDFGVGNARYITFLNVLNNPILKPFLFENVNVNDNERQNQARKGDLFFNTSSETPEEVGICSMLEDDFDDLYLNSFCFGYRLNDQSIYPKYLSYYFRSNEGRKLMTMLAQGVTRYNMSKSAFNAAKISMPASIDEQKAITDILECIDHDIESISIKKAKYVSIKQGMMQQLLSGLIRFT